MVVRNPSRSLEVRAVNLTPSVALRISVTNVYSWNMAQNKDALVDDPQIIPL